MRSIRIESDGMKSGTRVIDVATGEELQGVTGVSWRINVADGVATATVDFIVTEIDAGGLLLVSTAVESYATEETA